MISHILHAIYLGLLTAGLAVALRGFLVWACRHLRLSCTHPVPSRIPIATALAAAIGGILNLVFAAYGGGMALHIGCLAGFGLMVGVSLHRLVAYVPLGRALVLGAVGGVLSSLAFQHCSSMATGRLVVAAIIAAAAALAIQLPLEESRRRWRRDHGMLIPSPDFLKSSPRNL